MSVPIHLECNWGLAINTPIYIYIYIMINVWLQISIQYHTIQYKWLLA